MDTPAFRGHTKDAREQKLAQEKARKEAEKTVVKLAQRSKLSSRPKPEAAAEKPAKTAHGNPFLDPPEMEAPIP